ncbi:MAG: class I SAM-dependent methyltransferase [Chthoniobacterales bacterium]
MSAQNVDAESFKLRDASSYDPVSATFDRLTERFTVPLARTLVELAELRDAERVLDLGSGTGVVAFQAAAVMKPTAKIIGVDLSEGMLQVAKRKALENELADTVRFVTGDVEELEFADASFDRVLSLFAILHFPNPAIALGEMHRVLRPGGRLVIGFGSGPPLFSVSALRHFFRRIPELFHRLRGAWLSAPDFLEHLVRKHLPAAEQPEESQLARSHCRPATAVPVLLRDAGFQNLQSRWEGHLGFVETAEEFWALQATYSSLARKRLLTAPPEALASLKDEFFGLCRQVQERNGRLAYRYGAHFITATRSLET